MSGSRLMLLLVVAAGPVGVAAQEGDGPGLALLEYLGSWDDTDEEWLVVADEYIGAPAESDEDLPRVFPDGAGDVAEEDEEADENDED